MHLDDGCFNGGNGICQSDRCMRIGARIEDDALVRKSCFVKFVEQFAFVVALEIMQDDTRKILLHFFKILLKRALPINMWLSSA